MCQLFDCDGLLFDLAKARQVVSCYSNLKKAVVSFALLIKCLLSGSCFYNKSGWPNRNNDKDHCKPERKNPFASVKFHFFLIAEAS